MEITGFLNGLKPTYAQPVEYLLSVGNEKIILNYWLGKTIRITFQKEIRCIACDRKIKKTYNSGYCYPCFKKLPENDLCIVKPHECHYHLGTCRDNQFGEMHCMKPHYVYLAVSSDIKVGLTRKDNELKRWMDQGAVRAIPIAELPTRKMAGELEFHLSGYLADKTNWRKMLLGEQEDIDLLQYREEAYSHFPDKFKDYILRKEEWTDIDYPIIKRISEIKSLNLEKQQEIEGRLLGIKGQYLIMDKGVMNLRKFSGYKINMSA